jgi:signal transduction histidine kinase
MINEITLLNQTFLSCLNETNKIRILKAFTETGLKIIKADFGFVWLRSSVSKKLELVYKSSNLPFEPHTPNESGRNYRAIKNSFPDFVSDTKKVTDANYVSKYTKSFVIVPLVHKEFVYGSMVLCSKEKRNFTKEDRELSVSLGNTVAQAMTIHDFTAKEYENLKRAEMLKYTWKLLQQEKIKTEFVANATHELRTPIAIIKGNVDLAIKSGFKNKKSPVSALRAIDHEIKHLSQIISDLTLITSGTEDLKDQIVFKEVNLKSLVLHVAKKTRTISCDKKISIIAKNIPDVVILGDKKYLEKMLINLTKNSVTYGKEGGRTEISVENSKKFVTIKVTDNGIGIAKNDLPRIFERFYRVDKSHSVAESTGLGLPIVKWVAEAHGGKVSVKSVKNKGSVFSITLPIKIQAKKI